MAKGKYNLFVSDVKGKRVEKVEGRFEEDKFDPLAPKIKITKEKTHQTIIGFGGAFTDTAGVNIASLPKSLQTTLLRSMFSEEGSEYSLGRVPIGGSDFSLRPYTYQDAQNGSFALQSEDFRYKVSPHQKPIESSKTFFYFRYHLFWKPCKCPAFL